MFRAYMADDVILVRKTGVATWGEKSTNRKQVKARVEDKNVLVRGAAGENILTSAVVYINDIDLIPSDRITINGVEHPILSIKKHKSFSRTGIMEVGIG